MKRKSLILTLPVLVALAGASHVPAGAKSKPSMADQARPAAPTTPDDAGTTVYRPKPGDPDVDPQNDAMQGVLFPYPLLDYALSGLVTRHGDVDYATLKGNHYLDRFVKAVASADVSQFPVFKKEVKTEDKGTAETVTKTIEDHSSELAFWINAYNSAVLKAVCDAYPVVSPDNIKNFDTDKTRMVAGKSYSFAELRAKIAKMDPRALFTLTDATRSGPLIALSAYRFSGGQGYYLDDQLDRAIRIFVDDQRNVQLLRIQNQVTVNPYFAEADPWFKSAGARRKWDGVRQILKSYGTHKVGGGYFVTSDYQVLFAQPDRHLNAKEG